MSPVATAQPNRPRPLVVPPSEWVDQDWIGRVGVVECDHDVAADHLEPCGHFLRVGIERKQATIANHGQAAFVVQNNVGAVQQHGLQPRCQDSKPLLVAGQEW